jgi:hypothetical protein
MEIWENDTFSFKSKYPGNKFWTEETAKKQVMCAR